VTTPLTPSSNGHTDELAALVERVTDRLRAGERVDFESVLRDHPAHAAELRELLPAMALMADLSETASGPGDAARVDDAPTLGEIGDFRIVRELGRGGMGVVYEAEQLSRGRRVALKVLPFAATMDPRHLARFKNEARAAASLRHDHIVQVYGVGCDRGIHYYAMELIEGRTLAQVIDGLRPSADRPAGPDATLPYAPTAPAAALPTERSGSRARPFYRAAAALVADAADALEYAHGLGIVHRDVKPGNLLLDAAGRVYVGDFGLARVGPDAGLTMSGDLLGTLRYMSPEQALARHGLVDHRTDVYGLGAVQYELLTGRPAVRGTDRAEVLRAIAFEDPVAPRKLDRSIPAELETIARKALEKNPAERYQSARDLADDLRRWLGDQTIRARPATLRQRATKWARRHKYLVRGAAAALVVAVAAGAIGSVLVWRKGQETEAAYKQVKDQWDRAVKAEADASAQRAAAEREKWRAGEEEADTKAFATFLANYVLAATRPTGAQGGVGVNVTMAEALEKAEPKLAEVFAGRPKAEALARHAIGVTWRNLGLYAKAEEHLRRAIELRRQHLGPTDRETLDSVNSLATVLTSAGRTTEALPLREEVFDRWKATLGPDHAHTLIVMSNLADDYERVGRHDETLALRKEALRLHRAKHGPDHPDTITAVSLLARAYINTGREKDAIPLLERAREGLAQVVAPDSLDYYCALRELGEAYAAVGLAPKAIPLLVRALEGLTRIAGPDHDHAHMAESGLAMAYVSDGRAKDAIPLLERARAGLIRLGGPDHPNTLDVTHSLGDAYRQIGQTPKAIPLLKQALAGLTKALGPDNEHTLTAVVSLGEAYVSAGRAKEAIPLLERAREGLAQVVGPDGENTLATGCVLGTALSGRRPVGRSPLPARAGPGLGRQELRAWAPGYPPLHSRVYQHLHEGGARPPGCRPNGGSDHPARTGPGRDSR
jgi:serine/threonine protein kinase